MSAVYTPGVNPGGTRLWLRQLQSLILLTCECFHAPSLDRRKYVSGDGDVCLQVSALLLLVSPSLTHLYQRWREANATTGEQQLLPGRQSPAIHASDNTTQQPTTECVYVVCVVLRTHFQKFSHP
jgi:hypothetical protein